MDRRPLEGVSLMGKPNPNPSPKPQPSWPDITKPDTRGGGKVAPEK